MFWSVAEVEDPNTDSGDGFEMKKKKEKLSLYYESKNINTKIRGKTEKKHKQQNAESQSTTQKSSTEGTKHKYAQNTLRDNKGSGNSWVTRDK